MCKCFYETIYIVVAVFASLSASTGSVHPFHFHREYEHQTFKVLFSGYLIPNEDDFFNALSSFLSEKPVSIKSADCGERDKFLPPNRIEITVLNKNSGEETVTTVASEVIIDVESGEIFVLQMDWDGDAQPLYTCEVSEKSTEVFKSILNKQ